MNIVVTVHAFIFKFSMPPFKHCEISKTASRATDAHSRNSNHKSNHHCSNPAEGSEMLMWCYRQNMNWYVDASVNIQRYAIKTKRYCLWSEEHNTTRELVCGLSKHWPPLCNALCNAMQITGTCPLVMILVPWITITIRMFDSWGLYQSMSSWNDIHTRC